MAENKIVVELEVTSSQATKNLNLAQEAINALANKKKELAAQEKALTKAIGENGVATDKQTAELKDLAEQQVQNNLILKENKQEYAANEKIVNKSAQINKLAAGSVAQLAAQHTKDKDALRNLSKAERENTEAGRALNKKVLEQSEELKALEASYGTTSRSVGDYGKATESVLPLLGGFGQQIQGVISNLGQIKEAIGKYSIAQKGMNASTKATSGGLKAFRIALISTGIGAIVVVLGTLIAAFASTQRGVDALTSVMRPLQEVFQSIIGFVQDLATGGLDRLKKAFSDPKQAVIDLGNAIKDNLITRVLAVPKLIKAAAGAYINSFKLIGLGIKKVLADVPLIGKLIDKKQLTKDLEIAKQDVTNSFADLKDASIELGLGVDAEKVKDVVNKAKGAIGDALDRGTEIDILTKQIERASVNLERQKQKGLLLFAQQKKIAEDTTKSAQEQLVAAAKAQQALKDVTKLEVDQKNRQIALAQLKAQANDTDIEGQKEIQDLIAEREGIEAAATEKSIEIRNKLNSIAKSAEDKRKKAVEDQAKLEKKVGEDKIKAESTAIDKKIELLNLERQLELATIDETNEQKIQKEKDLLDTIGALRVEKAKLNGEDVAEVELENKIAKAEKEKEVQDVLDEEENVRLEEQEAFKQQVRSETVDLAVQGGKALINAANTRAEREKDIELANLNAKLEGGLISQADFEKKKIEIEKAAFAKKKKLDLAVIAIDLVKELSAISAAAAANPANAVTFGAAGVSQAAVLSAVAIARSGVQAAVVASQKFAQGGVLSGASHAQGGIDLGNNQEGEGGEAIINKRSTRKHIGLLSAINQDGEGVSLTNSTPNFSTVATKYANGGVGNFSGGSQIDLNDLRAAFSETMSTIKVQNVASETTGVSNRVEQIQDSASF